MSRRSRCQDWLHANAKHDGDECLMWPFNLVRGYGMFGYQGNTFYAHRYMCELVNGPAPSPLHHAAHSCGRGHEGCVNPLHISWKTPSENMLDKRTHGTWNVLGGTYKLDPDKVAQIRALKGLKTQDEMARMFGVSRRSIGAVIAGKTWPNGGYTPKGGAVVALRRAKERM